MTLGRRHGLYLCLCLGLATLNVTTLVAWYHYSRENASASHIILIPLVSVFLVYQQRQAVFSRPRWAVGRGLGVSLAGVAILAAGFLGRLPAGDSLTWRMAGMVLVWSGGFLFLYGPEAAHAALFPLGFLAFTVPFPQALLDGATHVLKRGSTETVAGLFALTGTPYFRDGFTFSLPNVVIVIADECSGIRSSIALLLTSLLAGEVFLDKVWARTLLVLVAVPLAVLKNGIRIVALSLLALHVDRSFLDGQLHHEGGYVFFLLALAMLGPVLYVLRRFDGGRTLAAAQSVTS